MIDVFVSYKSDDRDRVRPIVEALEGAGWEVWWDKHVEAGRAFDREIENAIDGAKCVLVVWSATSIDSDWVRNEASEGLDRAILVPVSIDDVRPPLAFRRQQTINFHLRQDYDEVVKAVERLVPLKATTAKEILPCVGRDRETSDMHRVLEAVSEGTGGTVFVGGEPGIGKTRLIREVKADAIRQGFNVLTGNCRKEIALPYEPWIEQFEQTIRNIPTEQVKPMFEEHAAEVSFLLPKLAELIPDIPERVELPPEQERRFLMNGIAAVMQKQSEVNHPLVLIFEDLQWADESTCLLIQHLAERIEGSRLLILGTYRNAEMESTSPAAAMFQTLLRERLAEDIILRRLRRPEAVQMIHQLAGKEPPEELVDLVFEETEGNPFFIEEVYRHLLESGKIFNQDGDFHAGIQIADAEVPRGILMVIQSRLERLSENCHGALTLAAVTGRTFSFRLMANSSDLDEDSLLEAIEEAVAATLIEDLSTGREASYRFVHEQVRQTLLHDLSFPRRQRMHVKIAEALKKAKGRTVEIAHHLYAAGDAADADETLGFLEKAIDEGLEALAFEDVLSVMDQADDIVEGDEGIARMGHRRATALRGSSDIEGAASAFTAAIDKINDEALKHGLVMEKIRLLVDAYRADATVDDLDAILKKARANGDEKLALEALLLLTKATYQQSLDQPGKAKTWYEVCLETVALARKSGDQVSLSRALMNTNHAVDYWPEKREEIQANIKEAGRIAHETGDDGLELDSQRLGVQIFVMSEGDRELEAENIRKRLVARRDPLKLKEYLFWMMWQMHRLGRARRSVEVATEDIGISQDLNLPPVQYPTIRGLSYLDLGRFQDAFNSIDGEVTSGEYRFGRAFQNYGYAFAHYYVGDFDTAFNVIDEHLLEMVALKRSWIIESLMAQIGRDIFSMPEEFQTRAQEVFDALVASTTEEDGPRPIPDYIKVLFKGDRSQAIECLEQDAETAETSSYRRHWIELEDALQRLYMAEGQWDKITDYKESLFQFLEHESLNRRHWTMLAYRARAWLESGQRDKARTDAQRARELYDSVLATIPSETQRECFRALPMAEDLRQVLEATA